MGSRPTCFGSVRRRRLKTEKSSVSHGGQRKKGTGASWETRLTEALQAVSEGVKKRNVWATETKPVALGDSTRWYPEWWQKISFGRKRNICGICDGATNQWTEKEGESQGYSTSSMVKLGWQKCRRGAGQPKAPRGEVLDPASCTLQKIHPPRGLSPQLLIKSTALLLNLVTGIILANAWRFPSQNEHSLTSEYKERVKKWD